MCFKNHSTIVSMFETVYLLTLTIFIVKHFSCPSLFITSLPFSKFYKLGLASLDINNRLRSAFFIKYLLFLIVEMVWLKNDPKRQSRMTLKLVVCHINVSFNVSSISIHCTLDHCVWSSNSLVFEPLAFTHVMMTNIRVNLEIQWNYYKQLF